MKKLLTSLLATFVVAACSGKPAIPDEQQAREYSSTSSDESTEAVTTPEVTPSATKPTATGPVATVNGKPITAEEFNIEIERGIAKGMQPGLLRQLTDQLVSQLIDRTLIDSAVVSSGVEVKDEEVNAKLDEVREEFAKVTQSAGQASTLEEATAQMGISAEELRESLVQAIAIEKILASRGFQEPDDEAAKNFYEDNKMRFERTEQVRLHHILVKVEKPDDQAEWDAAEKKAKMLRADVAKKDADFAAIAKEHSDGPMAATGGDLGFRERGLLPEEIDAVAFQMKVGELSQPVKSPFGWHILKLADRAEAGIVPFEEISEQLKSQLKTEAINAALTTLLSELRASATVERHPDNIE